VHDFGIVRPFMRCWKDGKRGGGGDELKCTTGHAGSIPGVVRSRSLCFDLCFYFEHFTPSLHSAAVRCVCVCGGGR